MEGIEYFSPEWASGSIDDRHYPPNVLQGLKFHILRATPSLWPYSSPAFVLGSTFKKNAFLTLKYSLQKDYTNKPVRSPLQIM